MDWSLSTPFASLETSATTTPTTGQTSEWKDWQGRVDDLSKLVTLVMLWGNKYTVDLSSNGKPLLLKEVSGWSKWRHVNRHIRSQKGFWVHILNSCEECLQQRPLRWEIHDLVKEVFAWSQINTHPFTICPRLWTKLTDLQKQCCNYGILRDLFSRVRNEKALWGERRDSLWELSPLLTRVKCTPLMIGRFTNLAMGLREEAPNCRRKAFDKKLAWALKGLPYINVGLIVRNPKNGQLRNSIYSLACKVIEYERKHERRETTPCSLLGRPYSLGNRLLRFRAINSRKQNQSWTDSSVDSSTEGSTE